MSGGVPHFQNYVGWLSWRSAASHLLTVSPVHSSALFWLLWTVLPSNLNCLQFGLQFQQRLLLLDGFQEKKRDKVTQCHEVTLWGLGWSIVGAAPAACWHVDRRPPGTRSLATSHCGQRTKPGLLVSDSKVLGHKVSISHVVERKIENTDKLK